ncbi:hypothetical protein QBC33DRAFT_321496 [Phialemonium atrogriseum]|uniref:DUF3824 domain-containing protein n=1 Tax=Phialemonium atrogriseum TaxID=1093897 RepID=A0AAJ0FQT0_9PEZI|nr:uncharacterized protein QBC33DRAFT_321496 [Phialemonium atrogriseum]KAK1769470.1 hypothetical protein QBC33DRAFT_321496 [Phialemonium atrogriseum]
MSAYYPDEAPARDRSSRRTYYREDRRDDRDPRYADPRDARDSYLSTHSRDLIPRPREDSDLSVEEVHRDFPPPGYTRDIRRARSAGPFDDYDDRRSHYSRDDRDRDYDRDYDRRSKKGDSHHRDDEEKKRARMLGKQEQIIAALAGAAVAIGGKELFDRRGAKQEGVDVQRNVLASAALGAAGAFAGYQGTEFYNKHQKKLDPSAHKGRDGYYSDDADDSKDKKGHKNFLEGALAAAGLGGAVKALTGGSSHDDKKSDTRSRHGSASPKGRGEGANKVQKAAMASLIAGATEAFRVSKEPGGWKGEKAKRILTAAAGAATIDAAQNPEKSNKLALAESVIGGLVGNRVINGSKRNIEEDKKTGRSRSRSRAKSDGGGGGATGLAALATAGLGAFGAKKLMDNRERSRSRRPSADSHDSRGSSPDRRRHRSRSRSVVDTARRSLAKFGIGNGPDDDDDDRDRRHDRKHQDDFDEPRGSRRHRRHDSDDEYDDHSRGHGRDRGGRDGHDDDRSRGGRDRSRSRQRGGGRRDASRGSMSESDLGDSDEDQKRAKKIRGKQILTTGLAAVATIHAAHNVYQSMEKRSARQKAVKEGRLSPEAAKKLKSKALLQDAASVGIAALGIKSAVSELKEVREKSHEWREWQEERAIRHQRRLERQKRLTSRDSHDDGSNSSSGRGRRRADDWSSVAPPRADRYDDGPRYSDGNPYSALPAPPVGYSDRR